MKKKYIVKKTVYGDNISEALKNEPKALVEEITLAPASSTKSFGFGSD